MICINFLIYANWEKLKRKFGKNFINYFVNKYHLNFKKDGTILGSLIPAVSSYMFQVLNLNLIFPGVDPGFV